MVISAAELNNMCTTCVWSVHLHYYRQINHHVWLFALSSCTDVVCYINHHIERLRVIRLQITQGVRVPITHDGLICPACAVFSRFVCIVFIEMIICPAGSGDWNLNHYQGISWLMQEEDDISHFHWVHVISYTLHAVSMTFNPVRYEEVGRDSRPVCFPLDGLLCCTNQSFSPKAKWKNLSFCSCSVFFQADFNHHLI